MFWGVSHFNFPWKSCFFISIYVKSSEIKYLYVKQQNDKQNSKIWTNYAAIIKHNKIAKKNVTKYQTALFGQVFCGPLFVFQSFVFHCISFHLRPLITIWYLQAVLPAIKREGDIALLKIEYAAPEITSVVVEFSLLNLQVFFVQYFVDNYSSLCHLTFDHCIVCPSYGF